MNHSTQKLRRRMVLAGSLSLVLHLLLLMLLRLPRESERFVVTTIVQEPPSAEEVADSAEEIPQPELTPEELAELRQQPEPVPPQPAQPELALSQPAPPALPPVAVVAPQPPLEPPPEPVAEETPPEPEPESPQENLPSISQPDRGADAPEEATALAEFDNSTDDETMAEETVVEDLFAEAPVAPPEPEPPLLPEEPWRAPSEPEAGRGDPLEIAREEPLEAQPQEELQEAQEAVAEQLPPEEPEPRTPQEAEPEQLAQAAEPLPASEDATRPGAREQIVSMTTAATVERVRESAQTNSIPVIRQTGVAEIAYQETFGERDALDRVRHEQQARRDSIVGDHEARWERTRAALENFDVQVRPGNETSINTRADAVAAYVHYLHNRIHERWWAYLERLDRSFGAGTPLANMSLEALIEFAVSEAGSVSNVRIVRGSGVLTFDAEAVDLLYAIGPHNPPPAQMLSPDGRAWVRWTFHRDQRGCGTFGASVHRINASGSETL